jgi:hypothetical protein
MKSIAAAFVAVLTLGSGLARAQEVGAPPADVAGGQAMEPPSPPPNELPPAPPAQLPPPPQQEIQSAPPQQGPDVAQQAPAEGQWTYTAQYGWVWLPYGDQYTYAPTQTGVYPSEYVYYPSYGWTWLAAPWVFGWGAAPYWGVYGAGHFGWYNRLSAGGWRGYNGVYGYRPAYGARAGYGPAVQGYATPRTFGGRPGFQGGSFQGGGGYSGGRAGGGFHGGGFSGGHGGGSHGGGRGHR